MGNGAVLGGTMQLNRSEQGEQREVAGEKLFLPPVEMVQQ